MFSSSHFLLFQHFPPPPPLSFHIDTHLIFFLLFYFFLWATDVIVVPLDQAAASECTSNARRRTMQGVGLCFSRLFPGPSLHDHLRSLFAEVAEPAADAVAHLAANLARMHLDTHDLRVVHERPENSLSVQSDHLDGLARILRFETTTRHHVTLADLGCADGVVTNRSAPDGYARKRFRRRSPQEEEVLKLVTLVAEVKHSTDAPVEGLRQAAAEATNVALAQARAGVPVNRIRVPLWSSNGQLMKFGVVLMLEPAFPYLVVLTKTLDTGDALDRQDAARILLVFSQWCVLEETFEGASRPDLVLGLSPDRYFLKRLDDVTNLYESAESGLQHMIEVLARFRNTPAQVCVTLPITIMTRVEPSHNGYLVFPHLSIDGYRLGMPPESPQREALLKAIQEAVRRIHDAGVVHVDLYFSNIMWRCDANGTVLVKVIDWDSVHANGECLADTTRNRISKERLTLLGLDKAPMYAEPRLDLVFLEVLAKHCDAVELQVDNKQALDKAFRHLVAVEAAGMKRGACAGSSDHLAGAVSGQATAALADASLARPASPPISMSSPHGTSHSTLGLGVPYVQDLEKLTALSMTESTSASRP
jgi:hypothetical protein